MWDALKSSFGRFASRLIGVILVVLLLGLVYYLLQ